MVMLGTHSILMAKRFKIAVLISGSGSNLQALIDAAKIAGYPAEIALVISNKTDAHGLTRAEAAGISTKIITYQEYTTREFFDTALDTELRTHDIDIICLAGFMRILSSEFVLKWQGRIINIHPSLLPKYKGLNTHQRALDAGDESHGCTVHHVIADLDAGPIIMQARLPIEHGDTAVLLANRVLNLEHLIYPQALATVCRALQ
jgi:phosphoribosylglycinamide formyltransferase 1